MLNTKVLLSETKVGDKNNLQKCYSRISKVSKVHKNVPFLKINK